MCVRGGGGGGGLGAKFPDLTFIHSGKPAAAVDSHPSLLQRMSAIVESPIVLFQRLACTNNLSDTLSSITGYQLLVCITNP